MRAYVVGNVVMDETFEVRALPQNGQSILGTQRSSELGGKGANQAIVLARCGVPVTFIGGVGDDAQAEKLRAQLALEPLDARFVTLPDVATDLSIVLADPKGGNAIITTVDCARSLDVSTVMPVLDEASCGDFLVLQGNLAPDVTAELFDVAGRKGLRVVFNPSPEEPAFRPLLGRADMVFLNETEAETYTGRKGEGAVRDVLDIGCQTVVLTRGAQGALLGRPRRGVETVPAYPCEVVDATGAGDTYQSVALAAVMLTGSVVTASALKAAARAAAITISRFGTVSALPSADDLRLIYAQLEEGAF